MSVRTVKVSNVSLGATLQDISEFFSFSGDIQYVEMTSDTERSQIAFVTFKDSQGAETAVLLTTPQLMRVVGIPRRVNFCIFYQPRKEQGGTSVSTLCLNSGLEELEGWLSGLVN